MGNAFTLANSVTGYPLKTCGYDGVGTVCGTLSMITFADYPDSCDAPSNTHVALRMRGHFVVNESLRDSFPHQTILRELPDIRHCDRSGEKNGMTEYNKASFLVCPPLGRQSKRAPGLPPIFKEAIDDWLKTFRKKNAFVWLTIQSPESITNADIAASVLDNIFSFLLLPNDKVESHRAAYKKNFGLDDHQIDMIPKLQPKRDYLLVQGSNTRVLQTRFSPEVLAYLRSEAKVLSVYEKHKKSGAEDWQTLFLGEIASIR